MPLERSTMRTAVATALAAALAMHSDAALASPGAEQVLASDRLGEVLLGLGAVLGCYQDFFQGLGVDVAAVSSELT